MPELRPDGTSRLMLFFAIVYSVEGFCQAKVGIVWQPLTHYLKETQGWDVVQIAASLAVLDVPWVVKPLYGMKRSATSFVHVRRRYAACARRDSNCLASCCATAGTTTDRPGRSCTGAGWQA